MYVQPNHLKVIEMLTDFRIGKRKKQQATDESHHTHTRTTVCQFQNKTQDIEQ